MVVKTIMKLEAAQFDIEKALLYSKLVSILHMSSGEDKSSLTPRIDDRSSYGRNQNLKMLMTEPNYYIPQYVVKGITFHVF
jgi:hypothetical protein